MVDDSSDNESLKRTATKWLFGQEANTIALFAILAALGYAAYLMPGVVEKHLTQIHAGYKEINDANIAARKDQNESDNAARKEIQASFKESVDRLERIYGGKPLVKKDGD